MKRRACLLGLPVALSSCGGVLTRPYVRRRDWALAVPLPPPRPPRANGKVLLVRSVEAAPGLGDRGLKTFGPDGLMRTDFYNRWAVTPAEGVGASLRQYLATSGLFAAVLGPGSLARADLTLEAELMQLWAEPEAGRAVASLAIVLLATGSASPRVLLQATEAATTVLPAKADAAADVAAQLAALASVFSRTAAALARFA
ncbi:MAG: ABC-type transport auxiliary lipoprotein family protein [Rhodospirillales bacterium]|nr:ABC-type transport auxiliary lipoprotein family protein [Rhodospirillales bacterium]